MRPARLLLAVLGLVLAFALAPVHAQDATPAASPIPLGAEFCTVEPIDPVAYYEAVWNSIPPLQQPANPVGQPADENTIAAVTDTIQQSIACTNIGDLGGLLAVLDPAYAPTLLGVPLKDVEAALQAAADASNSIDPATPLVDDVDQGGLVSTLNSISNVQMLENGSVSALVEVQRVGFDPYVATIYLRMDETTGRYVITNYTFHETGV
jgi:hypothetical protein